MRLKDTLIKLSLTPVLVMALVAGACSEQGTSPEQLVAPEHADFARGGAKKFRKLSLTEAAPLHASAVLNASGGVLQAGHYFLVVPGGAVKAPTTFSMDVATDGVVTLDAVQVRSGRDIGSEGFGKKLFLALYYGNSAELIADENGLQIGQMLDNGTLSPVKSGVDTARKIVYGELNHFSRYAIAIPRSGDDELY